MTGTKERLDVLLVKMGYFDTREKAQKNIMAGLVFIDNQRVDKCGEKVKVDSKIEVKGNAIPYVSRGGLKLEKAIKEFDLNLNEKICMDVGASTGGFTDCMLKQGAQRVFAVDVGYGQMAWELRVHPNVVCMERTNIRYVTKEQINCELDFSSIDVSFISLKLVLPVVKELLKQNGEVVSLIKPQFEAGREKVGKKGVVRDSKVHEEVIEKVVTFGASIGLSLRGLTFSPIKGPEGNIEYLAYFVKTGETNLREDIQAVIGDVVLRSHSAL